MTQYIREIRFTRGPLASLLNAGLSPGEPGVAWDDPLNPLLYIGDRGGVPRRVAVPQHVHGDGDLTGLAWTKITGVPATFNPSVHVHLISDVTGLQAALDARPLLGHGHSMADVTGLIAALAGKQAQDGDLDAIAGLVGSSGLLRKTAANTWALDTAAYLTGNQVVTLTGDASGSGATAITVTIPATTVTGKVLTGYALGSNTALAATDTILQALGKLEASANARLLATAPAASVAWANVTGRPTTISTWTNDVGYLTGITGAMVTTALAFTPANKAGDSFTGPMVFAGAPPATTGASQVTATGSLGSPWAGKLYFGDGSGWKFAFSRRVSGVDTDLFTIQDNGNAAASGQMTATQFNGSGAGLTGTAASLTAGAANSVAWANVSGKPTTVSTWTNDAGYQTAAQVSSAIAGGTANNANALNGYSAAFSAGIQSSTIASVVAFDTNGSIYRYNLSALAGFGVITTGNIASQSVASASNLQGWVPSQLMRDNGIVAAASVDTAVASGFYRQDNGSDSSGLLVFNCGGSLGPLQMRFTYGGTFVFRNKTDSSTWTAWKAVITSDNIGSNTAGFANRVTASGSMDAAVGANAYFYLNGGGRASGTGGLVGHNSAGDLYLWNYNSGNIYLGSNATTRLYWNAAAGNWDFAGTAIVGVGSLVATGNITAYYSSDRRLKKNIRPIKGALGKLMQLRGVEFDWKAQWLREHGGSDGNLIKTHDVGVIAQEVRAVLPEVVAEREDGMLAVKYDRLVPLLIEAIKDQQRQIDDLKRRLA